ncbi:MAG: HIRAN domain-containing protein [Microbacterium sp.]
MDIEGEFARQDAIHHVIGRKPRLDEEIELTALPTELRPEPTNHYDANAVMVIINGWHVGYLPREIAAEYHAPLARLVTAGVTPMVRARLWAVTRRDHDGRGVRSHARVTLAVGTTDRLAPLNNPPAGPYSLIPWGSGLQVTGEEHHLNALSDFVTPSGDGIAIATLHALQIPATKGTTREVVEVRLDGERVGQMTPVSSTHFLPTIHHLGDQGLVTAAWARVKGSAVAAQVVLQATKAHELPADWFGAPATIPALYPRRGADPIGSERFEDVAEIIEGQRPEPMWGD